MQHLIIGSTEALPFVDASLDGVLVKNVLEHFYLEQAFRILHEVTRVLASEGILIIAITRYK